KRAKKRVRLLEPEQERDLSTRQLGLGQVMPSKLLAGLPKHLLVAGPLRLQLALQRTRTRPQSRRDLLHRGQLEVLGVGHVPVFPSWPVLIICAKKSRIEVSRLR